MTKIIAGIFYELLKIFNNIFITPEKQIKKVVAIYEAMQSTLHDTAVRRFLIFKAHNGGGIIRSDGDLYVSALYEDVDPPFESVKEQYQKINVDKEYTKMLHELIQNKGVHGHNIHYIVKDMPSCLLKGVYQAEGVVESRIYYLGQSKKALFFCSCSTHQEWLLTQPEITKLDLAVGKIKQNIR